MCVCVRARKKMAWLVRLYLLGLDTRIGANTKLTWMNLRFHFLHCSLEKKHRHHRHWSCGSSSCSSLPSPSCPFFPQCFYRYRSLCTFCTALATSLSWSGLLPWHSDLTFFHTLVQTKFKLILGVGLLPSWRAKYVVSMYKKIIKLLLQAHLHLCILVKGPIYPYYLYPLGLGAFETCWGVDCFLGEG